MAGLVETLTKWREHHLGAWVAAGAAVISLAFKVIPASFASPETVGYFVVGFWTIVPPVAFWVDWTFCTPKSNGEREFTVHQHDLGRNIWVAWVVILAAVFQLK
jgi:hypothetical protein